MPTYQWQGASTFRDAQNDREIDPGETVDIDEHIAGPQPEFRRVEESNEKEADADDGDEAEELADSTDSDDYSEEDQRDYEDRTARAEALGQKHWQTVVSTVKSGDADDFLDILEKVDDRNSVQDAIDDRREQMSE